METENTQQEVEKDATQKLVERMDKVADALLKLVENEATSEVQKGRLFAQCLNWCKVRPTLVPSGEGNKLKEMQNAVNGRGGEGNTGRTGAGDKGRTGKSSGAVTGGHGKAIEDIIASLPKPAHRRGADGDSKGAQRQGGGADSDGGGVRPNGSGNGAGHADGAGDSA